LTQADSTATPAAGDLQALLGLDASAPVAIKQRFPMTDATLATDRVTVYEIGASVYAACDSRALAFSDTVGAGGVSAGSSTGGIRLHIDLEHFDGTAWTVTRTLSNDGSGNPLILLRPALPAPGLIQVYSTPNLVLGSPTDGSGVVIAPKVDRFAIRMELPSGANQNLAAGQCVIHYGSTDFPSALIVKDNSARVATFTQDDAGNHISGLPSAATTDSAHRVFTVRTVQADPWGGKAPQVLTYETNVRLRYQDSSEYAYYVEDFNNQLPLERDIHVIELLSRSDDILPQDLVARTFRFAYPADFADSKLQVETYSEAQGWDVQGALFHMGGRGFTLDLAPGQERTHLVNPHEPTQFTFVVNNTGTEDDTISVSAADPGAGWTSTVLGGGIVFVKAGSHAFVSVEVVPPASATAGQSRTLDVHASSSFAEVGDAQPEAVKVTLTDAVVHKVVLAGPATLEVRPGVTKSVPLTLTNLGTRRDSFVVIPSTPANIAGWNIVMDPTSLQVVSGGSSQVNALVRAPKEAPTGQSFPLGLTAVQIGDSTISSRIDVSTTVFEVEGVLAEVFDGTNRSMRQNHGDSCVDSFDQCTGIIDTVDPVGFGFSGVGYSDQDFDYTLVANWDRSVPGTLDDHFCEQSFLNDDGSSFTDGIPDGWRFNYGSAINGGMLPADSNPSQGRLSYSHFSGYYDLNDTSNPVRVPAHTTRSAFVEVGFLAGDPCPANSDTPFGEGSIVQGGALSPIAGLKVVAKSMVDPTRTSAVTLIGKVEDPGTFLGQNVYSGGKHDNEVVLDRDQKASIPVQMAHDGLPASFGAFNLRAVNTGNEYDDLVLRVSGSSGWNHAIQVVGSTPGNPITCDKPSTSDGSVRCHHVGVYDEVLYRVLAQPRDNQVAIGDFDAIRASVASGDASDVSHVLSLTARAAGTFAYTAHKLGDNTRQAAPGTTVAFPFLIENLGTEADTYNAGITVGDSKWSPVLSMGAGAFVPGSHDSAQYLAVTVPTDATLCTSSTLNTCKQQFRVLVQNAATKQLQSMDFFVLPTAAGRLDLSVTSGPDLLIPTRGTPQDVEVKVLLTSGTNTLVNVTADKAGLPLGWTVTPAYQVLTLTPNSAGLPAGKTTFQVTAPADALGTSHAVMRFIGFDNSGNDKSLFDSVDATLNLASTFGLDLQGDQLNQTIAPGGDAIYNLTIHNLGLGQDTVRFTHTALPTGWTLLTNPGSVTLGPLEVQNVTVKLSAPTTAQPKDNASLLLFAASAGDPSTLDSVPLRAQVGYNELKLTIVKDDPYASPQQPLAWVLNVTNTGTLPDQVRLSGVLDTPGVSKQILNGTLTPNLFDLLPGETKQIAAQEVLGPQIPSDIMVQSTVTALSLLDARATPATATAVLHGHALPYAAKDVNGDGRLDYAVDRNRDATDGFEQFQASSSPGGRPVALPDLQRFLSDSARDSLSRDVTLPNGTVVRALVYSIDGDKDGKADFFLDFDGDNQPDAYWDPDANRVSPIEFRKDVNGDQVPEVFVDTDGDGNIDAVFDMTRGTFTNVLQTDVDGDGHLDYVVDKNGNGQVDQDETVLYTRSGKLLIVQKVDVDGDGKLDQVFDTDGDGNPDYFIPNGSTQSVPIVLRDVNGDGVMDWTFDGNNDGRNESYYDPATGESHVISPAGHLMDALKHYWYIGALFALVLVLFVALVMVTRR
jgi:uncharacterized membrane protein